MLHCHPGPVLTPGKHDVAVAAGVRDALELAQNEACAAFSPEAWAAEEPSPEVAAVRIRVDVLQGRALKVLFCPLPPPPPLGARRHRRDASWDKGFQCCTVQPAVFDELLHCLGMILTGEAETERTGPRLFLSVQATLVAKRLATAAAEAAAAADDGAAAAAAAEEVGGMDEALGQLHYNLVSTSNPTPEVMCTDRHQDSAKTVLLLASIPQCKDPTHCPPWHVNGFSRCSLNILILGYEIESTCAGVLHGEGISCAIRANLDTLKLQEIQCHETLLRPRTGRKTRSWRLSLACRCKGLLQGGTGGSRGSDLRRPTRRLRCGGRWRRGRRRRRGCPRTGLCSCTSASCECPRASASHCAHRM